jgi:multidrug efflux system outer membrane protein
MTARPDIFLWYTALVGIRSGCSMNPVYTRPTAPISAAWPEGPAYRNARSNEPSAADLPWRKFFTDEKLQQVITLALENNRGLRLAALNVERARALYGIQCAEWLPTVHAWAGGAGKESPK